MNNLLSPQMSLMKRTAWLNASYEMNPSLRPPKPTDRQELVTAMYMLAYLGAIDMALIDLEEELTIAGLYRHALKRDLNRIHKIVGDANGYASDILKAVNNGTRVNQYVDMFEYAYNKVQKCIRLDDKPLDRAYSIVKALSRLFTEAYIRVGAKTNHRYLGNVSKVLAKFEIQQLTDYNLDCIISKNVVISLG